MIPRTDGVYSDWVDWLVAFGKGRDLPAGHLHAIDPATMGQACVARLYGRCGDAVGARLQLWWAAIGRDLDRARSADELRMALSAARARLAPLEALARSALLPQDLRGSLGERLSRALDDVQEQLEARAAHQRVSGAGTLRILREHPVNRPVHFDLSGVGAARPDAAVTGRSVL